MYDISSCDCSYGLIRIHPADCHTCSTDACGNILPLYGKYGQLRTIVQKRIWHRVRVPQSLYLSDLAALTVAGGNCVTPTLPQGTAHLNWNQSSDRARAHGCSRFMLGCNINVPSRGNSTRTSITRHRPGSSTPGGVGVDIKHNSYARYLARKKARNVVTTPGTYLKCHQHIYPASGIDPSNNRGFNDRLTPIQGNKTGTFGIVAGGYCCPGPSPPTHN